MITSIIVVKNNRIYNNIDRSRLSFFFDVPYAIPPFLSFSLILSLSYVCPINFFARSSSLSPIGEVKSLVAHNSAESKTTLLVSRFLDGWFSNEGASASGKCDKKNDHERKRRMSNK